MMTSQNYVNHIALVLDASSSMVSQTRSLIKVADDQIAHLAARSKELDQETRITVYTFANEAQCVIYDKDVLRLPSIAPFYKPKGMTALIDATILSQQDLALTPEKYGDHAFLTFVLTDGEENNSAQRPHQLAKLLATQPDHWTVAVLVPNIGGKHEAKKFGFPADNIAIWDTTSSKGIVEVGETIRAATDAYMTARSAGVRGTRNLFSTGKDAVNKNTVAAAGITPLSPHSFVLVPVPPASDGAQIRDFVQECGLPYVLGNAYYELSKPEKIQPQKLVAIVEKKTAKVYLGREARDIVGLPDMEVRVRPEFNPDYTIYVQSTSVNRKLVVGTKLLILR
jgi:hypothetical protein